ncbi:MAG: hypothetical protein ACJA01_003098 [Saprospiraceae bacterium]|jgi:hypothetical protein
MPAIKAELVIQGIAIKEECAKLFLKNPFTLALMFFNAKR